MRPAQLPTRPTPRNRHGPDRYGIDGEHCGGQL